MIRASNMGSPVTLNNAGSAPARAYLAAAKQLRGEVVAAAESSSKKGLLGTIFLEESRVNVLSFFHRPRSAPVARERLQLLLAHERSASDGNSDLLEVLRDEILQVIAKHVAVDRKN